MSYSSPLGSNVTNTKNRTPHDLTDGSGMCSVCTADCIGPCEIGLSAIIGDEAIYPAAADINQFAPTKNYPLDFSHFNINGRVFGALGSADNPDAVTYPKAEITTTFGKNHKVKLKAPIILPAMAKLNWKDYYAGAALSGVLVVIGEAVVSKDKNLKLENNKVLDSPLLAEMVNAFKKHYNGYGDIILQANVDDENQGVLEYAIDKLDIESVELKFGQAAKGIQGMGKVYSLEDALKFQKMGQLICPDPSDPKVAEDFKNGVGEVFEKIGRLPLWNEDSLIRRVAELKALGAKRVCFKVGPYDPEDLVKIFKIASQAGVDLITIDGASGGTGHSPVKMMNEWGIPTVYLESLVYKILKNMDSQNYDLPQVAIAGGFTMEDHVFKGLSLGAPYINLVGIGRGAMAAATVGRNIGDLLKQGKLPKKYGNKDASLEEVFKDLRILKKSYGDVSDISPGAIGLFSYIHRVSVGLRQLMALNRKFSLEYISRRDIVPLTEWAAKTTGLGTYDDLLHESLENL